MSTERKKNILIIDDSVSIRAYLRNILESENYNVTEAENGAVGVNIYREGNFDLVITDVYMPIVSGLEVVVKLRKEFPGTKIIVLSDGGRDQFSDYLEVCEALGASSFLSKSKMRDELLPLVNKTIND